MDAHEIQFELMNLKEKAQELHFETPEANGLKAVAMRKIDEAAQAMLKLSEFDDFPDEKN